MWKGIGGSEVGRCNRRVFVVGRCRNGLGGVGVMIGGLMMEAEEVGIGLGMIDGAVGVGRMVRVEAGRLGLDWGVHWS